MSSRDYDNGLSARRAVLGDEHVDKSLKGANAFTEEFQQLITEYAWGRTWTRPGLERRTRSLLVLAMMIALNRETEFKLHCRAAFNNGVSVEDIKEVILQSAIYCGVPAANTGFHWAQDVLKEMGKL